MCCVEEGMCGEGETTEVSILSNAGMDKYRGVISIEEREN